MDEDSTWEFNAPQHYCDLPSAVKDDDSEQADQYFFGICVLCHNLNYIIMLKSSLFYSQSR